MAENQEDNTDEDHFLEYRQKIRKADRGDMEKLFTGCKTMLEALGE